MVKATLSSLVLRFNNKQRNLSENLKELADIYAEARKNFSQSEVEKAFEKRCKVSKVFQQTLLDIAEGRLYPSLVWQQRGLLRVRNMSIEDQVTLHEDGVDVVTSLSGSKGTEIVQRLRLNEMTNEQAIQAITVHGHIRSIEHQAAYLKAMQASRASDPPLWERSKNDSRFILVRRKCVLSAGDLVLMLKTLGADNE